MAVMTPGGLKIRFPVEYVFTLIARLWMVDRRTDAWCVLRTCEGIGSIPGMLGCSAGLAAALVLRLPIWWILPAMIAGRLVGKAITMLGLFIVPGLVWLGKLWCYAGVLAINQLVAIVFVWYQRGWVVALVWIAGLALGFALELSIEAINARRLHRKCGLVLWSSEQDFVSAYRLHADRLGLTRDVTLSDSEAVSEIWRDCFVDYARSFRSSARLSS